MKATKPTSHMLVAPANPRVSIGLPVFNGERWLADALDSLMAQTYRDFELIISDNASTDATQSVCEQYAARDNRIRYVRQEVNRGLVWNWNHVFEISRGTYFKWSAYDDLYDQTFVGRCVAVLDENPDVVWCHAISKHIDATGELLLGERTPEISHVTRNYEPNASYCRTSQRPSDRLKAVLLGTNGLDTYGVIRSDVLRQTAMYLPYYGSEKVLVAELALRGRYYEVPETLCFARIHEAAAGNLRSQRQQRRLINPAVRKRQFDRLCLLRGYFAAVKRAQVPIAERFRCYAAIGSYLFQIKKWKSVLRKTIAGAGLAGEYGSPNAQPATGNATV